MTRAWTGLEIAIVGMAGRFPGAPDMGAFWRNLHPRPGAKQTGRISATRSSVARRTPTLKPGKLFDAQPSYLANAVWL